MTAKSRCRRAGSHDEEDSQAELAANRGAYGQADAGIAVAEAIPALEHRRRRYLLCSLARSSDPDGVDYEIVEIKPKELACADAPSAIATRLRPH
jgi:hypothetical protein